MKTNIQTVIKFSFSFFLLFMFSSLAVRFNAKAISQIISLPSTEIFSINIPDSFWCVTNETKENFPKHLITSFEEIETRKLKKLNNKGGCRFFYCLFIPPTSWKERKVNYNRQKSHKSFPLMHTEFAILEKGKTGKEKNLPLLKRALANESNNNDRR